MKTLTLMLVGFVLAITTAICQTRMVIRADMTGAGKGKTTFTSRANEAELQFEGERLGRNAAYVLTIGDWSREVNSDALGRARLSVRFSTSNRPLIQAGMRAVLHTGTRTVIAGTFVQR